MSDLKRPTSIDLEALAGIVGESFALSPDSAEDYWHDESPDVSAVPSIILKPADEAEIAAVMRYCNAERLAVVPRGLGTGVAAGAIAFDDAVLLSLERLDQILEIDEENLMVRVQPAKITGDMQSELESRGLFYPPDPASRGSCSIGGNVATNAGGMTAVKYGVTRNYVTGIRAVLPTGEVISYGGKLVKNVAGYDLLHTILGSEGTLAIITEVTLRLLPSPQHRADLLVGFDTVAEAAAAVSAIIGRKIIPTAIEFMEGDIVRIVAQVLEKEVPMAEAGAQLLISLDAETEEELERKYFALGEIAMELGAIDVLVADTRPFQERLWEIRRSMREALRAITSTIMAEDVAVPRARVPELWQGARDLGEKYGIRVISFGHAGDGNLHIDALKEALPDDVWEAAIEQWVPDLFRLAVSLGGTITAEHGIGRLKRQYLPIGLGAAELELMKRIKDAFDPNGILNPDKAI